MPKIDIRFPKDILIMDKFPIHFDLYSFRVYKLAVAEALQSQTCKLLDKRPIVKAKIEKDHYVVSIKTCCKEFNEEIDGFLVEKNLK
ncbi:MAG TPA: hypothetical protein VLC28_12525 [Flavitalea sp.]|nr:hypothetical protein [Flavitalea sp.]